MLNVSLGTGTLEIRSALLNTEYLDAQLVRPITSPAPPCSMDNISCPGSSQHSMPSMLLPATREARYSYPCMDSIVYSASYPREGKHVKLSGVLVSAGVAILGDCRRLCGSAESGDPLHEPVQSGSQPHTG